MNKHDLMWDLGPVFIFIIIVVTILIVTIYDIDDKNKKYGFSDPFQASIKCYEMLIDITNRLDKIDQKLGE